MFVVKKEETSFGGEREGETERQRDRETETETETDREKASMSGGVLTAPLTSFCSLKKESVLACI